MPDRIKLTFRVSPEALSDIRGHLMAMVQHFTSRSETADSIMVALEEALQNIIRHGYRPEQLPGPVEVEAWRDGEDLAIEFRDFAEPANLHSIAPRAWDPANPGGLGMRLILASMDHVRYSHGAHGHGNVLSMRKRLD